MKDKLKALKKMADEGSEAAVWALEEIAYFKERAIWWCAYAENGLHALPDAVDLIRGRGIIEEDRAKDQ